MLKSKLLKKAFLTILITFFLGSLNSKISFANSYSINIQNYNSDETVILNKNKINYLTRGDLIDAPVSILPLPVGKKLFILPSAMQQAGKLFLSHTFIKGRLDRLDNSEIFVLNEHRLFQRSEKLPEKNYGRHRITNTLKIDGGYLAFLHSEYTGANDFFGMACASINGAEKCAPGNSKISLAYIAQEDLDNENIRFTFLGHIAGNASGMPHVNVHGTPVYITQHGGFRYVNILFSDPSAEKTADGWILKNAGGVKVARARSPLFQVTEAAKRGELSVWKKKNGNAWVDSITGESTSALPRVPKLKHIEPWVSRGSVMVHSDVVFHRPSKTYYLIAYTIERGSRKSGLVLYSSCNGESWRYRGIYNSRSDGEVGWSYLTFLSRDNSDNGVADKDIDLLASWDYGKKGRALYRLKLEIGATCNCMSQ